jgi:hypothetical protein
VIPLLVVVIALWVSATQGPYYVGENSDPDYVYALNALNILTLQSPVHVDHPGTPLQTLLAGAFLLRHTASCLAGECPSIAEDVLLNPERFLNFGSLILIALLAFTVHFAGRRVYALTNSLPAAAALQVGIFLFPAAVTSLARVTPEPLLIICSLLYVLPFLELACHRAGSGEISPDAGRLAALAGVAFAAGITTKVTFLPLLALALLLPTWRTRLRFAFAAALGTAIFLLPILPRLGYFFLWIRNLLTHRGHYGGGEAGAPTAAGLLEGGRAVLVAEPFLPLAFLALLVFAALIKRVRLPLLLSALAALAQFLIVAKHPGARYLIPCFVTVAFGFALVLAFGNRFARAAVAVLVLLSCFPASSSLSRWAANRRYFVTSAAQIRQASAAAGSCQTIGFYLSSDKVSGLLFGDEYTGGLHAPLLRSLYPNATRYFTFGGLFQGFGGTDQLPWLLDQLRAGRCFLLQGSVMVEAAWPAAKGIERTEIVNTASEKLFLLSLPGVPVQRQPAAPPPATPGTPATTTAPLSTAVTTIVTAPGPGSIILEAEAFSDGNTAADKAVFGGGIGVLTSPKVPAQAEYKIDIPATDNYEIFARYATESPRPVQLFLNGKMVNREFCGNPTGGYFPPAQRWFPGGVFNIAKGKLTLRLESSGPFPHIDKIALVPMRSPK